MRLALIQCVTLVDDLNRFDLSGHKVGACKIHCLPTANSLNLVSLARFWLSIRLIGIKRDTPRIAAAMPAMNVLASKSWSRTLSEGDR